MLGGGGIRGGGGGVLDDVALRLAVDDCKYLPREAVFWYEAAFGTFSVRLTVWRQTSACVLSGSVRVLRVHLPRV